MRGRGEPVLVSLLIQVPISHSFPGGRVDNVGIIQGVLLHSNVDIENHYFRSQSDASLLEAALRETHEEVGIHPDQIEVLGRFGPPELSLGGMRVWPYVVRSLPHFSFFLF